MFVWTPDMIRFMQAANEKSDYHARLAAILAPRLSGCRTLCDAGCGLGALSAALSPYFEKITAADVSDEALDVLRQTIRTRQLTNITPLHCDLLTSEDRTQYDAMVFCFFGSLAEILPVARRQCAKTVIIIKKNYDLHRFSLTEQPIRGETAPAACETLRKLGVPFEFDAQELEHGQPFASLDEAVRFFRIYSRDETPGAITPEAVLPDRAAADGALRMAVGEDGHFCARTARRGAGRGENAAQHDALALRERLQHGCEKRFHTRSSILIVRMPSRLVCGR